MVVNGLWSINREPAGPLVDPEVVGPHTSHFERHARGIGMPSAFEPGADFSGMVDGGGIWIDRVEHEAFIEVDERGTRAAAATGGALVESHGQRSPSTSLTCM